MTSQPASDLCLFYLVINPIWRDAISHNQIAKPDWKRTRQLPSGRQWQQTSSWNALILVAFVEIITTRKEFNRRKPANRCRRDFPKKEWEERTGIQWNVWCYSSDVSFSLVVPVLSRKESDPSEFCKPERIPMPRAVWNSSIWLMVICLILVFFSITQLPHSSSYRKHSTVFWRLFSSKELVKYPQNFK